MAENPFAKYVPSTAPPASDNPFAKYVISTPATQEQAVDQMPVARRSAEPFMGVARDVGPAMSLLSPQQKREALKTGVVGWAIALNLLEKKSSPIGSEAHSNVWTARCITLTLLERKL